MAEAAGFVMAALPLVIEGLKFYLKGIESIKKWWKYVKVLERIIRKLKMEKMKFENTCTELLYELVGDQELGLLLKNPGGAHWRNASLQVNLRKRLGSSFSVFLDAVTDMTEAVEEFKAKLELDEIGMPKWLDYKSYKREWKRVQFSLSEEGECDKLIKNMEKDNRDLADLLGHSQRMAALKSPVKSSAAVDIKNYERIRSHAKNLYNLLRQSFTWPCGCSKPHYANLRLEARNGQNASNVSNPHFNVLFSLSTEQEDQEAPLDWRETRIERLNREDTDRHPKLVPDNIEREVKLVTQSVPGKTSNQALLGASRFSLNAIRSSQGMEALKLPRRAKKVSFAPSEELPLISDSTSSLDLVKERVTRVSSITSEASSKFESRTELEKIECLCRAIHTASSSTASLGILIDDSCRLHRVHIVSPFTPRQPTSTITLARLLESTAALSKKDRLILGVKLASSLLQLHKTPWLHDVWSKQDVIFTTSPSAGTQVQTPFVSKSFHHAQIAVSNIGCSVSQPPAEVRSPPLFALGVLLIELWFSAPIESLRSHDDLGPLDSPNAITDFATARRLVEDIYREAGQWYGDAVRRCIFFEFDQRWTELEKHSLQEAVHQGVVVPLEENLGAFCGGITEGLGN